VRLDESECEKVYARHMQSGTDRGNRSSNCVSIFPKIPAIAVWVRRAWTALLHRHASNADR